MAPRTGVRRERDNDFSAVGKLGRRTGVALPQGRIDENGIEEITGIFSSPRKPSPLRRSFHARDIEDESSTSGKSIDMVGMDSTGLAPTQVLSTRKSLRGLSLPPPRSASPKKSGINGIARRSNGVDVFSVVKYLPAYEPENQENSPVTNPGNPNRGPQTRRFSPSPEKSPLRDITTASRVTPQTIGKREMAEDPREARASRTADVTAPIYTGVDSLTEEAVSEAGEAAHANAEFDASYINSADNGDNDEQTDRRDPSQSYEQARLPEHVYDDEETDQTFEPPSDVPVEDPGPTKANSRKKRKSDAMDRDVHNNLPSSPAAKKARKIVNDKSRTAAAPASSWTVKATPSNEVSIARTARGRPAGKTQAPTTQFSTQQEAELEQIVEKVRARPGQSKSLYILRRETPADDAVTHTRSGRISVKPLAYWRNERCVYGGSPSSSSLQDGARFPVNSIKEIIRVDEVETSEPKPMRKWRKGKSGARSRTAEVESDAEDRSDEDPDAEPWESAVGIFRGPVSIWDPQQQAPLEQEEEIDLAYAPAAIEMREVPGSTFRYAKLLSTKFFGTGIVDLPPGGVKRPKNSRKMHMSFFVAKGRVAVQTGPIDGEESRFSVGKGGFWQVPRGNQYSIENNLDKPARIFFSQGCERTADGDD